MHVVTVTGAYVAAGGRFIPRYVVEENEDALARRWTGEWRDGIDGTGCAPA